MININFGDVLKAASIVLAVGAGYVAIKVDIAVLKTNVAVLGDDMRSVKVKLGIVTTRAAEIIE